MNIPYIISNLLIKILPPPIRKRLSVRHFKKFHLADEMWGGGKYSTNLSQALKANLTEQELADRSLVRKLSNDIISCYIFMGASPEEYFAFEFRYKNFQQRDEFLTNKTKSKILRAVTDPSKIWRLRDKYIAYTLLKEFYKRDVCMVSTQDDLKAYTDFIHRHNRYFVKPIDGMCGKGAKVLSGDHFSELFESGKWVVEEIVSQMPEMAVFNDSSINTVRLPTFLNHGVFTPLAPFLRTGRKGSVVDNTGQGGVFAALDAATGEIISDGYSEDNTAYPSHPDSGVRFRGFQVPHWDELLEIARKAHSMLSDQRYIAWDFALTASGWVLIEANSAGQFTWQYATKKGVKKEFISLMESD